MFKSLVTDLKRSLNNNIKDFWYINYSKKLSSSSRSLVSEESLYATVCLPKCKDNLDLHLHAIWLRDHCPCSKCYHSVTHQRLLETSEISKQLTPKSISELNDSIEIQWQDGHLSVFQKAWLSEHAYGSIAKPQKLTLSIQKKFWDKSIAEDPPTISYHEVMRSDKSLYEWLQMIAIYGFSFVKDVPHTIQNSQALAEKISFIRETHYGKYWDFSSDLEHNDTAYTTLGLSLHTDTTYFTDPIRLQFFHLLEFKGHGGLSLLLDGFHVAHHLKYECPEAFAALSNIAIASHCTGDKDVQIHPLMRHPILNHDEDGDLYQIRYNNSDRMVMDHLAFIEVERFYRGLRKWQEKLTEPYLYSFSLNPGTALIFDNWRVLHGRTAFTGYRRLTGCYLNGDDFCSRLRVLHHR
ncbi:hypothetical protein HMI54_005091 [Coelomomyces lativittatus]|nr:hypothetical protein HMI54_005091 [Coelomomyces lativittatus]KAJ1514108.1 hypothetical protein HMI56_001141 [Coelomomyces lativittatus]